MSLIEAELLARSLARYMPLDDEARKRAEAIAEALAGQEFLDLFGITDARLWNPHTLWDNLASGLRPGLLGPGSPAARLRIPLGRDGAGKLVWLDFKEDAQGGQGPHGMLTGMTGSGKSKLLRAIVLVLAMIHGPEILQVLLGDFKGEAEFANLAGLPHVVGVVSDLEKSRYQLDRFQSVLMGELAIRKRLVNEAGFDGMADYELARATTRPELDPIGALVIILDEFSELLRIRPEMGKVFDYVGRQGRGYWVHIFNASQRAEVAKMSGLIAQQTFAVGLKVKDATESRAAIGSPRAYEDITLKKAPPGTGFLVVDGEHTKFRSFFTKAPFVPPKPVDKSRAEVEGNFIGVHRFTAEVTPLPEDVVEVDDAEVLEEEQPVPGVDAPTVESVLVSQIAKYGQGHEIRPMWLPPLDDTREIPLDAMAQEFWKVPWDRVNEDGLNASLRVPYGREDDPFAHTQELVELDLSGAMGNIVITGATGTGKSTTASTLMMMLAISHSPERVQFYGLDFGGGRLGRLANLAHVCAIAGRGDDEKIRRVMAEVERIQRFRIRHWGQEGLDVAEFRDRKFGGATGEVPDDGHGDVFLVVDNIKALKDAAGDIHDRVVTLAEGALNYGIHLIVTSDSWISVNTTLEGKLRSRIELRLEHPEQSKAVDKLVARDVPNQPGRGLLHNGNHTLAGVPYFHRGPDTPEQQATEGTVTAISGLWKARGAQRAPVLRVLPAQIGYDELQAAPAGTLKLGIGENEMATVGVDLERAPHFYAVGSSPCGRTSVLRTLLRSIQETYTPEQAQVIIFEPARVELVDAIDDQYRQVYANSADEITKLCALIAEKLVGRQPPTGTPPAQLARWRPTGPKWFVVVDDLNLLSPSGSSQSALMPLVEMITKGRQVGLHVLAATSIERWYASGKNNKVIAAMDTAGAGVLVMDGNRKEGDIVEAVRADLRAPGRGELYYRKGGGQLVQVALCDARPA